MFSEVILMIRKGSRARSVRPGYPMTIGSTGGF
jgi:hypothetical protein